MNVVKHVLYVLVCVDCFGFDCRFVLCDWRILPVSVFVWNFDDDSHERTEQSIDHFFRKNFFEIAFLSSFFLNYLSSQGINVRLL